MLLGARRSDRSAGQLCFLRVDAVGVKLLAAAKLCVDEARHMGEWVHVGRVNSWRRLDLAASWDVDSVAAPTWRFRPTPTAPWPRGCGPSSPCREPAKIGAGRSSTAARRNPLLIAAKRGLTGLAKRESDGP